MVTASKPGYKNMMLTISVVNGEMATLKIELERVEFHYQVRCFSIKNPAFCRVYCNGLLIHLHLFFYFS